MTTKKPTDEDIALFRKTVGRVTRLEDDKFRPQRCKPSPRPMRRPSENGTGVQDMLSDEDAYTPGLDANQRLEFYRPGIAARTVKRLRRGQLRIDAELDLHGLRIADARAALARFLDESRGLDIRCVRIIHGKGFGSRDGLPVIKSQLDRWLRLRHEVAAFVSARPVDGGTGAVYVLLRS